MTLQFRTLFPWPPLPLFPAYSPKILLPPLEQFSTPAPPTGQATKSQISLLIHHHVLLYSPLFEIFKKSNKDYILIIYLLYMYEHTQAVAVYSTQSPLSQIVFYIQYLAGSSLMWRNIKCVHVKAIIEYNIVPLLNTLLCNSYTEYLYLHIVLYNVMCKQHTESSWSLQKT